MKTVVKRSVFSAGALACVVLAFFLPLLLALGFTSLFPSFQSIAQAQTSPEAGPRDSPEKASDEPPSVTLGSTGFKFPIPEIQMKRILGDRPSPEAVGPKATEPSMPGEGVGPTGQHPFEGPPEQQALHEDGTPRLPFEPPARIPAPETRSAGPTKKGAPQDQSTSPFAGLPAAPEEVLEALPPTKGILKGKAGPKVPDLLDNQLAKGTVSPAPLEPARFEETVSPESISLTPRREMEIIPPAQEELQPLSQPTRLPETPLSTEALPRPTLPLEQAPREPGTEEEQPEEASPTREEVTPPMEQLPQLPPLEEIFPSPLDADALESREVRDYLAAAAPVLEELSLLMTRVPGLGVEDYDASKANAPVVPQDVLVKMDSMKRDLQILDSKTFAIIPPQKYARFHSLIRESITETFRACESVISFFGEKNDEDLKKVREHLIKARALIQKTRKGSG